MAITPTEAQRRAQPDKANLKKLEKRIDDILIEELRLGKKSVAIDIELFPDSIARDLLAERYRDAGWSVTRISDMRDGDYLKFTPERNSSTYDDQRDALVYPYER